MDDGIDGGLLDEPFRTAEPAHRGPDLPGHGQVHPEHHRGLGRQIDLAGGEPQAVQPLEQGEVVVAAPDEGRRHRQQLDVGRLER